MTTAETFFTEFDPNGLLATLKNLIEHGAASLPRSQQRQLGPSQIGHGCPRHLALKTVAPEQGVPRFTDPLPSLTGTALHRMLEEFVPLYNELLGYERFIAERKVYMREGFGGTADLYDRDTETIVDWKAVSPERCRKYASQMNKVYRRQAHLYGLGYEREGFPVSNVAICMLPRGGQLRHAKLWSEPYDRQLALDTMARYDNILVLADELDVEHHPERFAVFPSVPSEENCEFCPFWSPAPDGNPYRCAGNSLLAPPEPPPAPEETP